MMKEFIRRIGNLISRLRGDESQPDWAERDPCSHNYIRNKPAYCKCDKLIEV